MRRQRRGYALRVDRLRGADEMKTESIKFYWNGIKVNGGKLIRTWYSIDNINDPQAVSISARDYESLPGDLFVVRNNSDSYTDYYDKDHATIEAGHPLYVFSLVAALKANLHMIETSMKYNQKRGTGSDYWKKTAAEEAEKAARYKSMLESLPDKQPTAEDLKAVEALRLGEETARRAAEHEEKLQEREKELNERHEKRIQGQNLLAASLVALLRASTKAERPEKEKPKPEESGAKFSAPVLFLRSIETEDQRFDLFAVPRGNGVTYSYIVNEYFPSLHKWRYLCQENNLSGDALLCRFGFNSFADLMRA